MARILIGNVKGPQGPQGATGPQGPQGQAGPAGAGIPTGGSDGQVLVKNGSDNYSGRWERRAKRVNEYEVGADDVIILPKVPMAENLESTEAQQSIAEYIVRTTAGDASVGDGDCWVNRIVGRRVHTGVVEESITMTVTSTADPQITAVIDRDTFVAYVDTSGTTTLTYTDSWSADPALYGITVSNNPASGDTIEIVYVKADRGTITQSNPTAFTETGWNLYDHSTGMARALDYQGGVFGSSFMVEGTYTKLEFATSTAGPWTEVTPDSDGMFKVTADGWIKVTGGNNTNTAIWMTWGDWTTGHDGAWEIYKEYTLDLTPVMTPCFPHGLCQVGNIYDEIDLDMQIATMRVGRIAYSDASWAAKVATGRACECDNSYIYYELETPSQSYFEDDIPSNKLTANDHGLEIVEGTTVPVYIRTQYGKNLKEYLEHDVPNQLSVHSQDIANIATVVTGTTNNSGHSISSGEYFIANGAKYKASATIGTGVTWSDKATSVSDHDLINALNTKIEHELYSDEAVVGKYNGFLLYRRIYTSSTMEVYQNTPTQVITGLPTPNKIVGLSFSFIINNNSIAESADMYLRPYIDSSGNVMLTQALGSSISVVTRADVLYIK